MPAQDLAARPLAGWGNYPVEMCRVTRPETLEVLRETVLGDSSPDYIPRGLGRAYGDSALNRDRGVILQTRRNRLIRFCSDRGELECEAGVSLADIIDVFLPRGWFLPTTPGTKFVTVGGAIAADVHGKNHHVDGSFGAFVEEIKLLTASGEVVTCSPTQRSELFWATIGGMGLTGCIISATIRLLKVPSAYVDVTCRRCKDLDTALTTIEDTNPHYRYSVAWIDCLATKSALGRSVLMVANEAPVEALPAGYRSRPLELPKRQSKSVPFHFPPGVLNSWSVSLFNRLYYRTHADSQKVVDLDSFFYPLDRVLHWNRIYGRRGFVQYQALFPPETSRQGLIALLERIASAGRASFLAVLKSTGAGNPGLLSFPRPGHTLALDIPHTGDDLLPFLRELDQILLAHGGRLYLAKDATTDCDSFRQMYPELPRFLQIKHEIDPQQRFMSSQARRLGLGRTATL